MAEKSGSDKTPLESLQRAARTRELVVRDASGLRYELDFPLKLKKVFQRNTVVWVGAALAVGLLVALLKARTQKVYVGAGGKKVRSPDKTLLQSGALLGALKFGMTLLQPMVISYFAKKGAKKGGERLRPRDW
jgi:hypothetical protein